MTQMNGFRGVPAKGMFYAMRVAAASKDGRKEYRVIEDQLKRLMKIQEFIDYNNVAADVEGAKGRD